MFVKRTADEMRRIRRKNAITGLGLLSFVSAVYGYSIWAVRQDNFDNVTNASMRKEDSL
jgi:hypothetical protein